MNKKRIFRCQDVVYIIVNDTWQRQQCWAIEIYQLSQGKRMGGYWCGFTNTRGYARMVIDFFCKFPNQNEIYETLKLGGTPSYVSLYRFTRENKLTNKSFSDIMILWKLTQGNE